MKEETYIKAVKIAKKIQSYNAQLLEIDKFITIANMQCDVFGFNKELEEIRYPITILDSDIRKLLKDERVAVKYLLDSYRKEMDSL